MNEVEAKLTREKIMLNKVINAYVSGFDKIQEDIIDFPTDDIPKGRMLEILGKRLTEVLKIEKKLKEEVKNVE